MPRLQRFAAARLSPEGEFGLHLSIGVVLLAAAALAFGEIAEDMMEGDTQALDLALANWLHIHAHAGGALTWAMRFITHWHSVGGMRAMVALLGCWLYARRAGY
ncbi:MAG TPA: hypothetical protein VF861_08320, partial [Telluria sp.]